MPSITRKELMNLLDEYVKIEISLAKSKMQQKATRGLADNILSLRTDYGKKVQCSTDAIIELFSADMEFADKIEERTKERDNMRRRIDEILYTYEII